MEFVSFGLNTRTFGTFDSLPSACGGPQGVDVRSNMSNSQLSNLKDHGGNEDELVIYDLSNIVHEPELIMIGDHLHLIESRLSIINSDKPPSSESTGKIEIGL